MLEVADALDEVLRYAKPLPPEEVTLAPAMLGRVLAIDVLADRDSPPFDKSLRDGFAVRVADCESPGAELRVIGEVPAGAVPTRSVGPGEAVRIFTGAPMPDGADAVVMQEDTQRAGDRVRITDSAVRPRQWVYGRGTEMQAGGTVLNAGTILNPLTFGVLASVGKTTVPVFPAPRVGVVATGNELVEPDQTPGQGQIRNSNGPMLAALALRGGGTPFSFGIARDDLDITRTLIGQAIEDADVVLIAGGVSVGDHDHVPRVLSDLGVTTHFRQVRMKPGKPLLFGTTAKGTLVFGLPGNPVSAFVCFELFVRPALRILGGHAEPGPRTIRLPVADAIAESNDRPTYRPATLAISETGWDVRPLEWSGSPDLRGAQPADALLVLPAGDTRVDPGALMDVVLL